MPTFKSEKETARQNISDILFNWKYSKYEHILPELSKEDKKKANDDNREEADIIAFAITEEIYKWFRKTRKNVITMGVTGQPGTPSFAQSLPITSSPDGVSGAMLWGIDVEFDRDNPEN